MSALLLLFLLLLFLLQVFLKFKAIASVGASRQIGEILLSYGFKFFCHPNRHAADGLMFGICYFFKYRPLIC